MRPRVTRPHAGLRRAVDLVLDETVAAFGGRASDRRIWARVAWRVGYAEFLDAVVQARSEARQRRPRPAAAELPRILQSVLNARFPKGGAR